MASPLKEEWFVVARRPRTGMQHWVHDDESPLSLDQCLFLSENNRGWLMHKHTDGFVVAMFRFKQGERPGIFQLAEYKMALNRMILESIRRDT